MEKPRINRKLLELKKAIEVGLNSGVSIKTVPDIMKDVERMMRAKGEIS